MRLLAVLAGLASILGCQALYSANSAVKVLNSKKEFEEFKKKHPIFVLEAYAPWCGHCKQFAPLYEKAASGLEGIVPLVAIDCDAHNDMADYLNIKGFPTVRIMSQKGAVEYRGDRTAGDLITWTLDQVKSMALRKAGAPAPSPSPGGGAAGGDAGGASSFYPADSGVVNLNNAAIFDAQVVKSDAAWLVEFFAPWCGHCKQAKPEFISAAKTLAAEDPNYKLGAVDCTTGGKALCDQYGVKGYPTFKFFGENKKKPVDYNQARTADGFTSFVRTVATFVSKPAPVTELTSQKAFQDNCIGVEGKAPKQLCVIAFLPDLLDSKADGRRKYISVLESVRDKNKNKPYGYFWLQGATQTALENNFGVGGFGYPALVVFSPRRGTFVTSTDAYEAEPLSEFLKRVSSGFVRPQPITGELAKLKETAAWDGQDAPEILDEEIPLEDLMKDEL